MHASRRDFLGLGLGLLAGCGGETEGGEMTLPPWHMWGNGQQVNVSTAVATPSGGLSLQSNPQLAKVAYGRPESWRFMFLAQVQAASVAAVSPGTVQCDFDLMIGIGRSVFQIPSFFVARFTCPVGTPSTPDPATPVWTSTVLAPPAFTLPTPDATVRPMDTFIAQDIQCACRVSIFSNSAMSASVLVQAMFAPNVHVRPEWLNLHAPGKQYRAGEENGT